MTASAREALRLWVVSGQVRAPSSSGDAAALLEAAREQRLVALLHAAMGSGGALGGGGSPAPSSPAASWLPGWLETLADDHRRLLVRGVGQLELMARVSSLMSARGLRVLPLKGAALAESLYESVAERPMGDVDVLVLDDWDASVAVLAAAGMAVAERADHAWSFVDPVTRGLVELHRSVTSCPDVFAFDGDGVWSRARPAPGQVARVPSSEDLLVQLAQHALFQHAGVLTLGQWLDFRRLVERAPPEVARLVSVASAGRTLSCVVAALGAARAIVGGPALTGLPDEATLPGGVRGWLDDVRCEPLRAVVPSPPPLVRLRWALSGGRRWRFVVGTLRPAGEAGEPGVRGALAVARRAAGLVRRWGMAVFR